MRDPVGMSDPAEATDEDRLAAIAERLSALPEGADRWASDLYVGEEGPGVCETWYGVGPNDPGPEPMFAAAEIDSAAVAGFISHAPRDIAFLLDRLRGSRTVQ